MSVEVLKFSATWCGLCKVLAQTLQGVEGITNIDIEKDMETAIKYGVRKVPLLIFLKDGEEIHRVSGNMSKAHYEQILAEINDSKELNN